MVLQNRELQCVTSELDHENANSLKEVNKTDKRS
jgi:hypothetical protein